MDNLKYNKSHAPDPTARDAITAADEMPTKVHDAVIIIKKVSGNLWIRNGGEDKDKGQRHRTYL